MSCARMQLRLAFSINFQWGTRKIKLLSIGHAADGTCQLMQLRKSKEDNTLEPQTHMAFFWDPF